MRSVLYSNHSFIVYANHLMYLNDMLQNAGVRDNTYHKDHYVYG
jgi:hypothetical protein